MTSECTTVNLSIVIHKVYALFSLPIYHTALINPHLCSFWNLASISLPDPISSTTHSSEAISPHIFRVDYSLTKRYGRRCKRAVCRRCRQVREE